MKKMIVFTVLALIALALPCQEKELPPIQPEEQPQVQAEEPPQAQAEEQPPAQPQGRDLNKVRFPAAFIHAGNEYPAGDYWLVLTSKDGLPMFAVQDAQKAPLFEDLAIVKARKGGRAGTAFFVEKKFMTDREYFRIKVTTPGEWLLGYFLIKK
jgi:hypothetical protein